MVDQNSPNSERGLGEILSRPGRVLASGSAWTALGQGVTALSGLTASVVAARVIPPADFGLMGVAMLAIAVLQALTQTGFERALVQREDVAGMLHVGWTFQVLRGLALTVVVLGLSLPVSRFYNEPSLLPVFAVISTSLLIQGFKNITNVIFARGLRFRTMFVVSSLSALTNLCVAIPSILFFRSVWALVVAHVCASVVEVTASYLAHRHRPRFDFDLKKAGTLFEYSKWVTGMSILALLVTRGDDIFVSKYLGTTALGYYVLAFEISNLPATQITYVLGRVSFPTYARLQNNRPALRQAFLDVMKATVLVSGPVTVLLWLSVPGIVAFVVGPRWEPIIPLVRVLALAGFMRSVAALGGSLFQACGVPRLDFRMNVPRLIVLAFGIWPACAYAGLVGAAVVVFLAVATCLPTFFYGLRETVEVRLRDVLRENRLAFVASAVLALSLWATGSWLAPASALTFALQLGVGLLTWLGLMWLIDRWTSIRLFGEIRRLSQVLKR